MILLMVLLSQLCSSSLECLEFLCKVLSQLNIRNVESSQEVLRIDSCCIGITNDRKSLFVSLFFFVFFFFSPGCIFTSTNIKDTSIYIVSCKNINLLLQGFYIAGYSVRCCILILTGDTNSPWLALL